MSSIPNPGPKRHAADRPHQTAKVRSIRDDDDPVDRDRVEPKKVKDSQATVLLRLAADCEYFHDGAEPYVRILVDDHFETVAVRSTAFRTWLAGLYYKALKKGCGREAVATAVETLAARAIHDGKEHKVSVRNAAHENNIYIDLGDSSWRVLEISRDGWRVLSGKTCPVYFRRPKGMAPLPLPVRGGSLAELRAFLNLDAPDNDGDDFILILAWMIAAMRPTGPFPILLLIGEQGSCKSTLVRMVRDLIDPNDVPLRSAPRDEDALVIAASNSVVVTGENLSHLPQHMSDAWCRLSTGAGIGKRKLYTDGEEHLSNVCRPVVINSISEIATAADFLDRAVMIFVPKLVGGRKTEKALKKDFDAARPRILGALLDAVVMALRNIDSVKVEHLPRMADFAQWVVAAEPAMPCAPGGFLKAYKANIATVNVRAVEASPVAEAVYALERPWSGTPTKLLNDLNKLLGYPDKRPPKGWPDNPHTITNKLRNIAPGLRAAGIDVQLPDKKNHHRVINIVDAVVEQPKDVDAENTNEEEVPF